MNVCLCSAFRNASGYIDRYFAQIQGLEMTLEQRSDSLALNLAYGDSADVTGLLLRHHGLFYKSSIIEVNHGGHHYGSIVNGERFKQLAYVWNEILGHVPAGADVVGVVESDLIWEPATLMTLIDHLAHVPAVAPMIMDGPNSFYDTFVFRMDGQQFTKEPPYLPRKTRDDLICGGLIKLESAGSVLFMRGDIARKVHMPEADVLVGLCRQIYDLGGSVWLDANLKVQHP